MNDNLDITTKVKFRFVIKDTKTIKAGRLMQLYSSKFSLLMSKVMSTKLSASDYSELPSIRNKIGNKSTLNAIMSNLDNVLPMESTRMLIDVTPVFDNAPRDLQAFILLALGVRPFNFTDIKS